MSNPNARICIDIGTDSIAAPFNARILKVEQIFRTDPVIKDTVSVEMRLNYADALNLGQQLLDACEELGNNNQIDEKDVPEDV